MSRDTETNIELLCMQRRPRNGGRRLLSYDRAAHSVALAADETATLLQLGQ